MGSSHRNRLRAALLIGIALFFAPGSSSALNTPSQFCTGNPCIIVGQKDVDPGAVLDFGTTDVVLQGVLNLLPLPSGAIGSMTLKAGSFAVVGATAQIKGYSSSGVAGGSVTIQTVNNIQIDGTIGTGAIRLSGADGGTLVLTSTAGAVNGSARISIFGDGMLASGGTIELNSGTDINMTGRFDIDGGVQGAGGELDITANGSASVTGDIDLTGGGGGGGFLDVTVNGSMTFGALDVSGSADFGDAGFVTIDAGTNVTFLTQFYGRGADNGEDCGDGADVDISAGGDITLAAMDIRGRGLDCSGGFLTLDAARVFMQGDLLMSGTGSDSDGGDLDVTATTLIRLTGNVALDGGDTGAGDISFVSDQDIEIVGAINAAGRGANSTGSTEPLFQAGKITISGSIDASGGTSADQGGAITIDACDVITAPTAVITSLGVGGSIEVTAHDTLNLKGHFTAANGGILVRYGPRVNPPNTAGAIFSPPATLILDNTVTPCRLCNSNADCDDGNSCSDDLCDHFTACVHTLHTSGPCEDGDLCTTGDTCNSSGVCVTGSALSCDDNNVCTNDICESSVGCLHIPIGGSCNDNNACTTSDHCVNSVCVGTQMNCSDTNPCTDDSCTAGVCNHTFNTAPCGSGNLCTGNDHCGGGVCIPGQPIDCNDHNSCTNDSCNPSTGCSHTPVVGCVDTDNDGKFDDDDECTTRVWTASPVKPPNQNPLKFGFVLSRLAGADGTQGMLLKGLFNVAPSAPLTIDPTAHGVHIYVADAGGALFDLSVPGGSGCAPGDGWQTFGAGFHKAWRYSNHSGALPPGCVPGSADGIQSIQVKDNRLSSKAGLQFKVKAKNGSTLRDPILPDTRLQVDFTLSAQPAPGVASPQAKAGQCAEAVFTGNPIPSSGRPYCKTKLKNGAAIDGVKCKGL